LDIGIADGADHAIVGVKNQGGVPLLETIRSRSALIGSSGCATGIALRGIAI